MTNGASPIDISTPPRYGSNSPRNQTSNLTSALQQAGATGLQPAAIDIANNSGDYRMGIGGRQDSIGNGGGSYQGTGARPIINPQDRPRRESNTGSFINGMSWGGASMGSFIRDE
jgi:transcription factor SFP1